MGLLEATIAADDYTRQSLVQVEQLYNGLPPWASSSFDESSNVAPLETNVCMASA